MQMLHHLLLDVLVLIVHSGLEGLDGMQNFFLSC